MFVAWHTITSYPPNRGNRDDEGNPKVCRIGDSWRGRISSQALNATRRRNFADLPTGLRTRYVCGKLTAELIRLGRDPQDADQVVRAALDKLGIGIVEDTEKTKVMLFLGKDQIQHLAYVMHGADAWQELLASANKPRKAKKTKGQAAPEDVEGGQVEEEVERVPRGVLKVLLEALQVTSQAVDLALHGRMVAERAGLTVTGAVNTAHSIGVSHHERELDYWIAVDDLAPDGGAGMVDSSAFSSGCFYGTCVINWPLLVSNLGDDLDLARAALSSYLWGTIEAPLPGGQHGFYSHVPPSLVLVEVGERLPFSQFNAFERPIDARRDGGGSLITGSIAALDAHLAATRKLYGTSGLRTTLVAGEPLRISQVEQVETIEGMIDHVLAAVVG